MSLSLPGFIIITSNKISNKSESENKSRIKNIKAWYNRNGINWYLHPHKLDPYSKRYFTRYEAFLNVISTENNVNLTYHNVGVNFFRCYVVHSKLRDIPDYYFNNVDNAKCKLGFVVISGKKITWNYSKVQFIDVTGKSISDIKNTILNAIISGAIVRINFPVKDLDVETYYLSETTQKTDIDQTRHDYTEGTFSNDKPVTLRDLAAIYTGTALSIFSYSFVQYNSYAISSTNPAWLSVIEKKVVVNATLSSLSEPVVDIDNALVEFSNISAIVKIDCIYARGRESYYGSLFMTPKLLELLKSLKMENDSGLIYNDISEDDFYKIVKCFVLPSSFRLSYFGLKKLKLKFHGHSLVKFDNDSYMRVQRLNLCLKNGGDVVIIGNKGTGKTSLGKRLSEKFPRVYVEDSDAFGRILAYMNGNKISSFDEIGYNLGHSIVSNEDSPSYFDMAATRAYEEASARIKHDFERRYNLFYEIYQDFFISALNDPILGVKQFHKYMKNLAAALNYDNYCLMCHSEIEFPLRFNPAERITLTASHDAYDIFLGRHKGLKNREELALINYLQYNFYRMKTYPANQVHIYMASTYLTNMLIYDVSDISSIAVYGK